MHIIVPSAPALSQPLHTPRPVARMPVRPPELRPRFTVDGSRELEDRLERTCAGIAAGIRGLIPRGRLEGILLGGGYGRGEGGVLRTDEGGKPYNDLEFYVFLRGNRHLNERRFGRPLHVLGEILAPQAGVDVEFKIVSRRELAAARISMFSYDLIAGHHRFAGADHLLAHCGHHRDAAQIPLAEGTRLLMNRGTGLLFARERLARPSFTAADADFVRRNIAKAELALGDAVLVAAGRYHWSVRERHRQLERIVRDQRRPWLEDVQQRHAAGVEFKLHPERSRASRDELAAQHAAVAAVMSQVWLWLEAKRLGRTFSSARDYASEPADKLPEFAGARSVGVNLKVFGPGALVEPRRLTRHPRGRILNALALLLWEPAVLGEPARRAIVQRELRTNATTFTGLMHAYRGIWSRVN